MNVIVFGQNHITLPQWTFVILLITVVVAVLLQIIGKKAGLKDKFTQMRKDSEQFIESLSGLNSDEYTQLKNETNSSILGYMRGKLFSKTVKVNAVIPCSGDIMEDLRVKYRKNMKKTQVRVGAIIADATLSRDLEYLSPEWDTLTDWELQSHYVKKSIITFCMVMAVIIGLYIWAFIVGNSS
jgi:hypothetical protein